MPPGPVLRSGMIRCRATLATPAAPSAVSVEATLRRRSRSRGRRGPIRSSRSRRVWRATTNNRASAPAVQVGEIGGNVYVDRRGHPCQGATYYYWLRAITKYGTFSLWSAGDTSGHNDGVTPTPPSTRGHRGRGDLEDQTRDEPRPAGSRHLAARRCRMRTIRSDDRVPHHGRETVPELRRTSGRRRSPWMISTGCWVGRIGRSYGTNLIVNGNSELGALAVGMLPESDGLVNEPSNAYAGQWCRKWLSTHGGAGLHVRPDQAP